MAAAECIDTCTDMKAMDPKIIGVSYGTDFCNCHAGTSEWPSPRENGRLSFCYLTPKGESKYFTGKYWYTHIQIKSK